MNSMAAVLDQIAAEISHLILQNATTSMLIAGLSLQLATNMGDK